MKYPLIEVPMWAIVYVYTWVKERVIHGNKGWNDSSEMAELRKQGKL